MNENYVPEEIASIKVGFRKVNGKVRDGELRRKKDHGFGEGLIQSSLKSLQSAQHQTCTFGNSGALAPRAGFKQLTVLGDLGLSVFQNQQILTELYETSESGDHRCIGRDRF